MKRGFYIGMLLLFGVFAPNGWLLAQFTTPVLDGVIGAGEYGVHTNGQNQQFEGGTTYYMCWDANNLYVAVTGSNFNEGTVIYLDRNPIIPVNGGSNADGSLQGFYTYERNHMMQPFRADFVLYYKNGYHEYRYADGGGYWGGQTSNTLANFTNGGTNTVEMVIPWNVVTQGGGRPPMFNWFTYKSYDYGPGINGIYHALPVGNPNCACNQDPSRLYPTRYYNILNTSNASSTKPFSTTSFTYYEDNSNPGTGGYYLTNSVFYDLTINDNSPDNADNDPVNRHNDNLDISNRVRAEGSIEITHNLYIGPGSALLPQDNAGVANSDVTFSGLDGSIYNFGRIDANPEADNFGDWNNRRINFHFMGVTRLQPTALFKDNFRLSNVRIGPAASLLGPLTDSAAIELQWGTFDNLGTLDLGDGTAGYCNLGTRGDWAQHNDYFFGGSGTWLVHDILIGRNSSRLQPSGSLPVNLQVQGDFENYDEFRGRIGAGMINVIMSGRKRQLIRGNINETAGAATSFYNLEIDNADLLGAWNNAADVWFESYGGGNVQYFVEGNLTVRNGDLVTRDRVTNNVHNLTLRDSATTTMFFLHSNLNPFGSAFVDGPLNWEVESAGIVDRDFPVGKTKTELGYAIGDARPIRLSLQHDAPTRTTYTVEMFLDDRSSLYTWPLPVPELITWISQQRYWNVTKGAGANVVNALITLSYDLEERNDGVTNPPALRIVKDDGAGNWVNIAVGGGMTGGGTGVGTGVITSNPFTTFSDFTLASIDGNMPLPVELLDFEAMGKQDRVDLEWHTATETAASHFVVERSLDRLVFEPIGRVEATGNSRQIQDYNFSDFDIEQERSIYFYRLRLVDIDGAYSYSEVRTATFGAAHGLGMAIWPNPAQGFVNLALAGTEDESKAELSILDLRGVALREISLNANAAVHAIDLSGIPAGAYILRVRSGQEVLCKMLVVE